MLVLRMEKLYVNLKKCSFCLDKVMFLGFAVSAKGIEVNEDEINGIQEWPTPKSLTEARSFHGLTSFYRHFVKNFNTFSSTVK